MGWHPIESLMKTTMESLKSMVDVNTVVGEPVETKEGTVIIPVSRVSFGFVTGGGDDSVGMEDSGGGNQDGESEDEGASGALPFTGGTGAGVTVRPVGFLVVGTRKVRFLPVDSRAIYDRLLDCFCRAILFCSRRTIKSTDCRKVCQMGTGVRIFPPGSTPTPELCYGSSFSTT